MWFKFQASRKQIRIFWATSLIIVILDQITKEWAQATLMDQLPRIYLGNFFRLEYAENPGAFLGLGNSLSDPLRLWIFTIFVFFIMLSLALYLHAKEQSRYEAWAYSLIFAGGMGNLIDRAFRDQGHVIDFMNIGIANLRTGIFNVADIAITLGLVILLLPHKKKQSITSAGSTSL